MRSWQIKAKSPVHGARKSFDNSLFVGFTKASFQIQMLIWLALIQNLELKALNRIQVIVFVAGKDKVGILLILFNAVMRLIVTIQSDHMMLPLNGLIDSVQDGQRLLIRP